MSNNIPHAQAWKLEQFAGITSASWPKVKANVGFDTMWKEEVKKKEEEGWICEIVTIPISYGSLNKLEKFLNRKKAYL